MNTQPTKEEIFKDIQKIVKKDYAGFLDKNHLNQPENYSVSNTMNDSDFEITIQDYLLDFNDGHLYFNSKESLQPNRGFSVRRFEDALYVKEIYEEQRLKLGDKIIEIDGLSIQQATNKFKKQLEQSEPERQLWNIILRKSKAIRVERNNCFYDFKLSTYEHTPYQSEHYFKLLDRDIGYMKLTDFAEEKPVLDMINKNKTELNQLNSLIIDVRTNYGGNDSFYFALLPYLFDTNIEYKSLFGEDDTMYTNYTKRNCDLWISELEDYLEQELDEETIYELQKEIDLTKARYNQGLIEIEEELEFNINGHANPRNIFVLTDFYCASSGETFVANIKKSSKVTVVGRPTMGIMDYFNVVTVDYDKFEFIYSISKSGGVFATKGLGIQPDIHIPWTPEHIEKDVDLQYVLDKLGSY